MKIVIVGAGHVGYMLAEHLLNDGHDIVMIEKDEERASRAESNLDVMVIKGNGSRPTVLERAGIRENSDVDVLVGCAGADEVNILACWIAKRFGVKKVIARARNLEFTDTPTWASLLGIDYMVSPERSVAREIEELLMVRSSIQALELADGKIILHAFKVDKKSPLCGKTLLEIGKEYSNLAAIVVCINRNNNFIVPSGSDSLEPGDIAFVVAKTSQVEDIEFLFKGSRERPIKRIVIIGGGKVGYRLAYRLEKRQENLDVRLIEQDAKKCEKLSRELSKTLIINGDGTDVSLLESEGVGLCDAFVTTTQKDEINLLSASLARSLGAKKCVSLVRKLDYMNLTDYLPVDAIVNFYSSMVGTILKYLYADKGASQVNILDQIDAQMMEFEITPDVPIAGIALKDAGIPKGVIVAAVIRGKEVIIPKGDTVIKEGDRVIVFSSSKISNKVISLFGRKVD